MRTYRLTDLEMLGILLYEAFCNPKLVLHSTDSKDCKDD